MNKTIASILTVVSGISFAICVVWVIVSFLIYLVKDLPFNWFVFWFGVGSLKALTLFWFIELKIESKESKSQIRTGRSTKSESNFQRRLREAQEKQAEKTKNKSGNGATISK